MSTNLATVFPQLNDPAWLEDREQCWQLALEVGSWKSDYRKKDLDKIRYYFFTGELLEGMPLVEYWGSLVKLFPIQTQEGYDYYYRSTDYTEEQFKSIITSPLHSSASSGHRAEEQKAYWDYHLGSTFSKTRVFQTATQRIEVEIDPENVLKKLIAQMNIFLGVGRDERKYCDLFEYFISALKEALKREGFAVELAEKCQRLFVKITKQLQQTDENQGYKLQLAQRFQDELERSDCVFPEAVLTLWREHKANRTA